MKKLILTEYLFYLCCCALIIGILVFEFQYVGILLALTFTSIVCIYIQKILGATTATTTLNSYFIIGVLFLMTTNYLVYNGFRVNFFYICISLTLFLLFSSFALYKYLRFVLLLKQKKFSTAFVVSSIFIGFLILLVSDFILVVLPEALLEIVIATIGVIIYALVSYLVYKSDAYKYGIMILISFILCASYICFTAFNELYLSNHFFTIFIVSSEVIGVYIFMKFLVYQDPKVMADRDQLFL